MAGRPDGQRTAIYARVSTGAQVDGTSLDTQVAACRADAERRGLTATDVYRDEGASGAAASRPALDEMMAAAREGRIDAVIVAKLDRLGRSVLHLASLAEDLATLDVRLIILDIGADTSQPTGRMLLHILSAIAEFERLRIRERTQDGLRARVQAGGFVGSGVPFGYRAVPDPVGRGVVLDIDPPQAATIRSIYDHLIVQRLPMLQVVDRLNRAGHVSDRGIAWSIRSLSTWARRHGPRTAAGTWVWGGVPVEIPAILSPVEAAMWQQWVDDTAGHVTSRGQYLLSGLVESACGARLFGRTVGQQAPTYSCPNRVQRRVRDGNRCDCANINRDQLDEVVWGRVVEVLTDPTAVAALAAEVTGGAAENDPESELVAAQARVTELRDAVAAEYQAAVEDGWDASTAREMVRGRQAEVRDAQAAVTTLTRRIARTRRATADAGALRAAAEGIATGIGSLDGVGRRDVLDALGVQVTITGYEQCGQCGGSGSLPLPPGRGRRWPQVCPSCRRMRVLPIVDIAITVPEALLGLAEAAEDSPAAAVG